jgi:lysophospholipase L1-like esterase
MPMFRIANLSLLVALAVGACSSGESAEPRSDADIGTTVVSATVDAPTTTVPNRRPELRVPPDIRVDVDQFWSDAIIAIDLDGDEVTVRILEAPPGFFPSSNSMGLITGFEWQPTDAGQWTVDVVATDSEGATTLEQMTLVARYPRVGDVFVAMGDSVSAGFGRDRSDYLGPDGCWRSEDAAYPGLVFDELVALGSLDATAEFFMVSCSGSTAPELLTQDVEATRRDGSVQGPRQPQLDWAVELNPTLITLTVGANDIQFIDPREVLVDDAGDDAASAIDEVALQERLDRLEDGLDATLQRIVSGTDAHVGVTTYYNPTAIDPIGVAGCRSACFGLVAEVVSDRLNETIGMVARRQSADRITLVRLDEAFFLHEATNGFGPDVLREINLGPFQDLVSQFTRDTFPYCSDGDGNDDTYVTRLDCAHPNDTGHQVIAEAVTRALVAR